MATITLDTNILAFAAFDTADDRHVAAMSVVAAAALSSSLMPTQVLIEFANASQKRRQLDFAAASRRIVEWATIFTVVPSEVDDILRALALMHERRLGYFDALIIAVAARAGAEVLLSEDMQDGAVIDGLTIVDPFAAANTTLLRELLA